jgi:HSP20 family molecular chaperone IbpA
VSVEGQIILAERSNASTTEEAAGVMRERRSWSAVRRFSLGEDIDPDGTEAHFRDRMLTVRVPVADGAQRQEVPVAIGSREHTTLEGANHRIGSGRRGKGRSLSHPESLG